MASNTSQHDFRFVQKNGGQLHFTYCWRHRMEQFTRLPCITTAHVRSMSCVCCSLQAQQQVSSGLACLGCWFILAQHWRSRAVDTPFLWCVVPFTANKQHKGACVPCVLELGKTCYWVLWWVNSRIERVHDWLATLGWYWAATVFPCLSSASSVPHVGYNAVELLPIQVWQLAIATQLRFQSTALFYACVLLWEVLSAHFQIWWGSSHQRDTSFKETVEHVASRTNWAHQGSHIMWRSIRQWLVVG